MSVLASYITLLQLSNLKSKKLFTFSEGKLHFHCTIINFFMLIWNFPCNCVHCSISSFVLSNQHFVIHFKFNIVPCINQNWGWHKNCRNMFLKVIFLNQLSLLTVRRFSQIGRQKNWSLKMGLSWKSLLICQYYGESSWNSLWTASKNPLYIFLKMRKVRAQKNRVWVTEVKL